MQTQTHEPVVLPRWTEAANEAFPHVLDEAAPSGWDPYEVWRTRIKAPSALNRGHHQTESHED